MGYDMRDGFGDIGATATRRRGNSAEGSWIPEETADEEKDGGDDEGPSGIGHCGVWETSSGGDGCEDMRLR